MSQATPIGVTVAGGFGVKPTLTIPATTAPTTLTKDVLTQGNGATVTSGDTLVVNYLGETWALKSGKVNVFDSSFDRNQAAGFQIGVGKVIPGWDKSLVGQKLGSRLLLAIPPADGYGTTGQASANISGTDTLVFVVDLVAAYEPTATAPGTVVSNIPTAGMPKITNVAEKEPAILSTAGVKAPAAPSSTLLVRGSGDAIDPTKTLVLQLVESDLATGKKAYSSWGKATQSVSAQNVLAVADKLTGQKVGSRALVLVPATPGTVATATTPAQAGQLAEILIIDVVGQF